MAIKNIIAHGIGFSPGSIKFVITLGFTIALADVTAIPLISLAGSTQGDIALLGTSVDAIALVGDSVGVIALVGTI